MKLFLSSILACLLATGSLAQNNTNTNTNTTTPGGNTTTPSSNSNAAWGDLLNATLGFYEYQKAGHLGPNFPIPWRHDSTLQDGADQGVNLSGGYFDAGDYLKFTMPLAYSLTVIMWGGIDLFQGYQLSGQTANLYDKIKWGMDWMINAHPSPNVLFVQVGDGNLDNNYWGPDTGIPTPRPSYQVNTSSLGTDIVAQAAASFAAASVLYRNDRLQNETYANILLQHAKDAYAFAEVQPFTLYTKSVKPSKDWYQASNYGDKLVWGALWLYRATNDSNYLTKASNYFDQFSVGGSVNAMDWSDQSGGVYVLGAMLDPTNKKYAREAENYLDGFVKGNTCPPTPGGLTYCKDQSSTNSIVVAADVAFLALMYSRLNSSNSASYATYGNNQLDYILGSNPEDTPYICGIHANSPQNPHHAGASGGTDVSNLNDPKVSAHVLYGAVVGGPTSYDSYSDQRSDYDQTEVALDYNAPLTALAAYQVIYNKDDPFYVSLKPFTNGRPVISAPGRPIWQFVVIVVSVIVVVVLLLVLAWYRCGGRRWWAKKHGKLYEMGYLGDGLKA